MFYKLSPFGWSTDGALQVKRVHCFPLIKLSYFPQMFLNIAQEQQTSFF